MNYSLDDIIMAEVIPEGASNAGSIRIYLAPDLDRRPVASEFLDEDVTGDQVVESLVLEESDDNFNAVVEKFGLTLPN